MSSLFPHVQFFFFFFFFYHSAQKCFLAVWSGFGNLLPGALSWLFMKWPISLEYSKLGIQTHRTQGNRLAQIRHWFVNIRLWRSLMGCWLRTSKDIHQRQTAVTPASTLRRTIRTALGLFCHPAFWPRSYVRSTIVWNTQLCSCLSHGFLAAFQKRTAYDPSSEPQKFSRMPHKQNVLGPERLIHLCTKEGEKCRGPIPLILTFLTFQLLYGGAFWLNGGCFQGHHIGVQTRG